jgi:hypothetical protein
MRSDLEQAGVRGMGMGERGAAGRFSNDYALRTVWPISRRICGPEDSYHGDAQCCREMQGAGIATDEEDSLGE